MAEFLFISAIWLAGVGMQPSPDAGLPAAAFSAQLRTCREGILDPQAREEDRRRWVQLLFTYESPAADALVTELLSLNGRPEVQTAVCAELAARGRVNPARLDPAFVDPLIGLLGSDSSELRTAAATTLAEFQDGQIAARLGELAADADAPMPSRLAAITALSANTHRHEVVEQLVALLESGAQQIVEQVAAALQPIAPADFGSDHSRWRAWLAEKQKMGAEAWLAEQVRIYRDRARQVQSELARSRTERERESAAVHARIRELQREVLRGLNIEQRESRLVEWLEDPLPVVKLAALSIVRSRIADEGKRPEGELLNALLALLQNDVPAVRRESLEILQNLRERPVVDAVLSLLAQETHPSIRLAILEALGKLGDPAAVDALIAAIESPESNMPTLRAAATALGQIAGRTGARTEFHAAVEPLRQRYRALAPDAGNVRAALLAAMAGVADGSFGPDFLEAVGSENPTVLEPAIRGLTAIQDASRLERIRALCAHEDPRVRLAAVDAVAAMGYQDQDLAVLQNRLTPALESNELVRQAAWNGWRSIVAKRPLADRVQAAERLRESPERETEYLHGLAESLAASGNHAGLLRDVRERLVTVLTAAGKHADAIPHLRACYESQTARSDPGAWATGIRWLEATLRTPGQQGLADLVVQLARSTDDEAQRAQIVKTVRDYVDSPAMANDLDRIRRMRADLGPIEPDELGEKWTELINVLDERLASAGSDEPTG